MRFILSVGVISPSAIENSLAGSVAENYDLLLKRSALIHRELLLRIRHNLIVLPGTRLADVRRVFSHPVALEQLPVRLPEDLTVTNAADTTCE